MYFCELCVRSLNELAIAGGKSCLHKQRYNICITCRIQGFQVLCWLKGLSQVQVLEITFKQDVVTYMFVLPVNMYMHVVVVAQARVHSLICLHNARGYCGTLGKVHTYVSGNPRVPV